MKPEYKQRAQENLEAINKRAKVINEMLNGERPANQEEAITKRAKVINEMLEGQRPVNQAEAIKLSKEIERLVELTTNIVDLS